jgi:hypothetical protein
MNFRKVFDLTIEFVKMLAIQGFQPLLTEISDGEYV